MKSTIKIELDHDNLPIIQVKAYSTDDVRDKMVAIFLKNLWVNFPEQPPYYSEKGLALVEVVPASESRPISLRIRTLNIDELTKHFPEAFIRSAKRKYENMGPAKAIANPDPAP